MIEEKSARPHVKEPGEVPYFKSCSLKAKHSDSRILYDDVDDMQKKIQEQEILINHLEYLLTQTECQCSYWKRIACA